MAIEVLVAEACAHGNFVPPFGTPAVEYGGPRLGLHSREETVRLRAVTAVWLEGTLRHDINSCSKI